MRKFGKVCAASMTLVMLNACVYKQSEHENGPNDREIAAATKTGSGEDAATRIKADVAYLADDARQGREAGSEGYEQAARYVAARMESIGLEQGAPNGWFQQVWLRTALARQEDAAMSITSASGEVLSLTNLEDYRLYPSLSEPSFEISAPAVFIGYGVHAPELGHDDFEGLDLDGKIVVYFNGAPDRFDSAERAHFGSSAQTRYEAARRGAIGSVRLRTSSTKQRWPWERQIANLTRAAKTWVGPDGVADISGPGVKGAAVFNGDASNILFEGAEQSYAEVLAEADAEGGAPKGFDLPVTISMKGALDITDVTSPNVIGVIPGSDPQLKNEYVVLTAHLDHIGVNERLQNEGKDGINNGALDNAMGVATMLEAAKRLVEEGPLARSVIILAVTGEEAGLLGADYFAHYPTVPIESIVANVNLDMPIVLYAFTDVIAFGAEHSSLGAIVENAAKEAGVTLSPDPIPEQGLFTRSDHYRFVEKGVPSVFLVIGFENGGQEKFQEFLSTHYHQPSDDTALPILYGEAARFADVNYEIARAIANAPMRPTWNEGNFFGELFASE